MNGGSFAALCFYALSVGIMAAALIHIFDLGK